MAKKRVHFEQFFLKLNETTIFEARMWMYDWLKEKRSQGCTEKQIMLQPLTLKLLNQFIQGMVQRFRKRQQLISGVPVLRACTICSICDLLTEIRQVALVCGINVHKITFPPSSDFALPTDQQ